MRNPIFGVPPRIIFHNPKEALSGMVQDKKASDLEERSARAITKLDGWGYLFRVRVNPITKELSENFTNLKGELEIDFLAQRGNRLVPIMIDGEIGHFYAAWMRDVDRQKTVLVDDALRAYNAEPVVRVEFWRVANQNLADQYFRELLL